MGWVGWGGFLVITVSHPTFCCVGVGLWLRWGWAVTIVLELGGSRILGKFISHITFVDTIGSIAPSLVFKFVFLRNQL